MAIEYNGAERNIMEPTSKYPLSKWREEHRHLRDTERWNKVMMLEYARDTAVYVSDIYDQWEVRLTNKSLPDPDIVAYIAWYGYARLLIQGWTEFPIEVPTGDEEIWREWGFGTSLFEFRDNTIAGLAGGFFENATKDPELTRQLIVQQLEAKVQRLRELTNKPAEWYTPEEFTDDERAEGEDSADVERLREPFDIFEQLVCFSYALEKFRMFSITDENPEVDLPSKHLYEELLKVDLNGLWGDINAAEPKLKKIRRFIGINPEYPINQPASPPKFWWRHWKPGKSTQRKR